MAFGSKNVRRLFDKDHVDPDLHALAAELEREAVDNEAAQALLEALWADCPELRQQETADKAKAA